MDKENLQTKVEALQDNLKVKHDELTEVQVIEYDVPLIDADKSGSTKTAEQITSLPTRNVQNVAATTAGIYQSALPILYCLVHGDLYRSQYHLIRLRFFLS